MKRLSVLFACLSLGVFAPAQAQDVAVFSDDDAEALLSDDGADASSQEPCPQGLANGKCVRTRGFHIVRPNRPPPNPQPVARVARVVPLQFTLGSSALSPQSLANLRVLAGKLNQRSHRAKRIQITGHTDRSGRPQTNRLLSQQRAEAVENQLVVLGVDRGRMEAKGLAFDKPLQGVSPTSPLHRRVEVLRVR